jgi:hypothetical protein
VFALIDEEIVNGTSVTSGAKKKIASVYAGRLHLRRRARELGAQRARQAPDDVDDLGEEVRVADRGDDPEHRGG